MSITLRFREFSDGRWGRKSFEVNVEVSRLKATAAVRSATGAEVDMPLIPAAVFTSPLTADPLEQVEIEFHILTPYEPQLRQKALAATVLKEYFRVFPNLVSSYQRWVVPAWGFATDDEMLAYRVARFGPKCQGTDISVMEQKRKLGTILISGYLYPSYPFPVGFVQDAGLFIHAPGGVGQDLTRLQLAHRELFDAARLAAQATVVSVGGHRFIALPLHWWTPAFLLVRADLTVTLRVPPAALSNYVIEVYLYMARQLIEYRLVRLVLGEFPLLYPKPSAMRTLVFAGDPFVLKLLRVMDTVFIRRRAPNTLLRFHQVLWDASALRRAVAGGTILTDEEVDAFCA